MTFFGIVSAFLCVFFPLGNPISSHPSSLLEIQHLWLIEIGSLKPKRNLNKILKVKLSKILVLYHACSNCFITVGCPTPGSI